MKTYESEVTEKYTSCPLNGTVNAKNEKKAIIGLKEWYVCELGTVENEINVKIIAEIVN